MALDAHIDPNQAVPDVPGLNAKARRLGLTGRFEAASGAGVLRLVGALSSLTISPGGEDPMLHLPEVRAGRRHFVLPDPGDVIAACTLPELAAIGMEITVYPPAGAAGPIDAIVPMGRPMPKHLGSTRWHRQNVLTPQSRLWLGHIRAKCDGSGQGRPPFLDYSGLLYRPNVCTDSAQAAEYLSDLGWPYLSFPKIFIWQFTQQGHDISIWAAATDTSVESLLLAALFSLDAPHLSPDACIDRVTGRSLSL